MSGEKDLITAHELAKELDLAVDTIWRYTREKRIPFVELGGKQYRYRKTDVINSLSESRVGESLANYGEREDQKMTYREYCELPAEVGYRFEVLDGILVRDPSPNVAHQRVVFQLAKILDEYFLSVDGEGEVFLSPLDVTIGDYNVVQPDLLYISGKAKEIIKKERVDGPPTLAVEVISTYSGRKDRMKKMQIYQKAGVEHYWLVDPEEKILECFILQEGYYARVAGGMDAEVVEHPEMSGLKIDLSKLW
jgi:excisionase family DNA binding protein